MLRPATIPRRAAHKLRSRLPGRRSAIASAAVAGRPRQQFAGDVSGAGRRDIHLWAPSAAANSLPERMPGIVRSATWSEVVDRVTAEHPGNPPLRVAVYPCAPLMCMQPAPVAEEAEC